MKHLRIVTTLMILALVVSACGGEKSENTNETSPQSPAASSASETKKAEEPKPNEGSDVLGQVEIIGEKTKKIGRFEITLESGTVNGYLNERDGKSNAPKQDQILIIKAKVKMIIGDSKGSEGLSNFSVYEPGEKNMGEDNYIGFQVGQLGQDLEGNLVLERLKQNDVIEGYLYLDVQKRDEYKIQYTDNFTVSDYWDVKITK